MGQDADICGLVNCNCRKEECGDATNKTTHSLTSSECSDGVKANLVAFAPAERKCAQLFP